MASAQVNETRIGFIAVLDMFSPIFVRRFVYLATANRGQLARIWN
jgi:hypothetical protein